MESPIKAKHSKSTGLRKSKKRALKLKYLEKRTLCEIQNEDTIIMSTDKRPPPGTAEEVAERLKKRLKKRPVVAKPTSVDDGLREAQKIQDEHLEDLKVRSTADDIDFNEYMEKQLKRLRSLYR